MIDARAAVLFEAGADPALTDVVLRPPVGEEVLVRIDAVGICHTDISVAARWPARRLPMVFGHEGAGTVVATGPQAELRGGQPVVLTFASCGRCPYCVTGRPAYCESSTDHNMRGDGAGESSALRLDGHPIAGGFFGQSSLATYAIARQGNAVSIDDGLEPALAAPLGCSVQTGVGTVLNALAVRPEDTVVVFGAGAVGLSAVMGARIAGCRTIVAVDPVPQRRDLAIDLGATAAVDPSAGDVTAAVRELTGGGAHAAVDTTAVPEVLTTALTVLRPRGALALVGLGAPRRTATGRADHGPRTDRAGSRRRRQRTAHVHPAARGPRQGRRTAARAARHHLRVRGFRRRLVSRQDRPGNKAGPGQRQLS
ncbi:aryl-alcohol dehydrogenase [Mycolicibacterium litorale]|uniref:Aryl-alcohol dehydrogenase n=1 Tax=Mycolicibacterium litorale TaxID=758802 RepID=A0A6S6P3W4_9MYCO|nr:zinc-binding dehydrogenase [Mycolicibacterium litorale]BCI52301.1 aryl-alcohol dehydrogenase [Mycolicibacterium litorale]